MLGQHMLRSAALLGLFSLAGTGLVALIFAGTEDRIAEAERAYMLRSLNSVIEPSLYDNDIFTDVINVESTLLGTKNPVQIFRARRNNQPMAVAITPAAPEGYGGPIKLIVGINVDGKILGVRILTHRETPGLGDAIEEKRSDWVLDFNDRSLNNPETKGWRVKRDGGQFDQFTGATITPRTIVKAVHNALKFFAENKELLFTKPSSNPEKTDE